MTINSLYYQKVVSPAGPYPTNNGFTLTEGWLTMVLFALIIIIALTFMLQNRSEKFVPVNSESTLKLVL